MGQAKAPIEGLGELTAAWTVGGPEYLAYRLSLVSRCLERKLARMMHDEAGISVAEWRVLSHLNMKSPSTVRLLADQSWVDPAEVSRAAAQLVERGDIERRSNPADRRSTLFYCTAKGRALYGRLRPLREALDEALLGQLDARHRAMMEEGLMILARGCISHSRQGAIPSTEDDWDVVRRRAH